MRGREPILYSDSCRQPLRELAGRYGKTSGRVVGSVGAVGWGPAEVSAGPQGCGGGGEAA